MKIPVPAIFSYLILTFSCLPVFGQQYFDQSIYVSKDLPPVVMESVEDMAYWLQKSSGKKYTIKQTDKFLDKGIQVAWAKEMALSDSQKQALNKDGQSFYLCIRENNCATIIGTGIHSFNNAIYTFLHELGYRWYMPGDAWTIVPTSFPKNLQISKIYTPDFQGRFYAGTGGVNAIPGTDPKNTFKQDYNLWNKRNRFNSDYKIKGHSGHLFYNENKKILDAHPEWFCNGKINRYGRMDISRPEVVKLFTQWALTQAKQDEPFPTIGIDPSDGAGGKDDCLPANMPVIKTWSDKYFWLANQVANKLDKKDNKTQVQLYAYANHAATPSFALEKNVYPIIIPYAFQGITSPDNFIRSWSKKIDGRPMGIYDYWNITQWSSGIPQMNIYSIPEKLRLWKLYNVTSINLETTNGKGSTGHALWLAGQVMWNTNISFDSLYKDFLNKSFGPAAPDIKNMYDRWSKNYQQEMEVDLSLHDLAKASSKTKDKAIHARLNELKAYVHYLKLFYDYKAAPKSATAYERLVSYVHAIHYLRLLQSSALLERYIKPPAGYKKPVSAKSQATTITPVNIEKLFEQDLDQHLARYSIPDFDFEINKAKTISSEPVAKPQYLNGRNSYEFFHSKPGLFMINAGSRGDTRLTITGSDGKIWLEKMIPASESGYTPIKIQLPAGIYTLSFGDFARFSRLEFPAENIFMSNGMSYYDNAGYPVHYAFISKDADAIIYEDRLGPGTNKRGYWINPDGKRVDPVKLKNGIYKIPVPGEYRGKVWTLNIGHRQFKLLNIPNRFSLRKFEYKED